MLTHEQLGIKQWEVESLIFFRDKLISGEYKLDMNNSSFNRDQNVPVQSACGSVVCLGGNMFLKKVLDNKMGFFSAERLAQMTIGDINVEMDTYVWNGGANNSSSLRTLFFPHEWGSTFNWENIPTKYIGHAINNFLNTGNPHWNSLREDYTDELYRVTK